MKGHSSGQLASPAIGFGQSLSIAVNKRLKGSGYLAQVLWIHQFHQ
jgi:hypothetical protein